MGSVIFVPLPKLDPKGFLRTTVGWVLLKRPKV
jgi:hypothetical protein